MAIRTKADLTQAQRTWADQFIGQHVKGTSTEGIVLRWVVGHRGKGIYLVLENGRLYRGFPKSMLEGV